MYCLYTACRFNIPYCIQQQGYRTCFCLNTLCISHNASEVVPNLDISKRETYRISLCRLIFLNFVLVPGYVTLHPVTYIECDIQKVISCQRTSIVESLSSLRHVKHIYIAYCWLQATLFIKRHACRFLSTEPLPIKMKAKTTRVSFLFQKSL